MTEEILAEHRAHRDYTRRIRETGEFEQRDENGWDLHIEAVDEIDRLRAEVARWHAVPLHLCARCDGPIVDGKWRIHALGYFHTPCLKAHSEDCQDAETPRCRRCGGAPDWEETPGATHVCNRCIVDELAEPAV